MEPTMLVSKWGNSLAVRLPKALVEKLGIAEGDDVNVTAEDAETIVI
jgi:antitoxin MazE